MPFERPTTVLKREEEEDRSAVSFVLVPANASIASILTVAASRRRFVETEKRESTGLLNDL